MQWQKNIKIIKQLSVLITGFILLIFCHCGDTQNQTQFGIFTVVDAETIELDGVIDSRTLDDFKNLIDQYPDIQTMNMVNSDGSDDDEANIATALLVHENEINTHLLDNGEIYSGAVDLFLSGAERTIGSNTKLGVHSWGSEDDDGNRIQGSDFPKGHPNHDRYIDYYLQIGFDQQLAEGFYYFTIQAAAFDEIHVMTEEEIMRYQITTN